MSHCKGKKKVGQERNVIFREQTHENAGYSVSRLPNGLLDVFMPFDGEQHFTYISPTFGEDVDYMEQVAYFARKAWEHESVPVNPYFMFSKMFPDHTDSDLNNILLFSLITLSCCHEYWLIENAGHEISDFQKFELRVAVESNIPVRRFSYMEEDEDE